MGSAADWPPPRGVPLAQIQSGLLLRRPVAEFYSAVDTSVDGMTADTYPFSHEFLGETMTRIINEVAGINRVFYDVTSKPPGTIELE